MWTLVVLMVGLYPPTGMVQYGFDTYDDCMAEARVYCNGSNKFRCKCSDKIELPPVDDQ